ncbi:HalOD1 output domain-containing protein [Haloprofundus halobius]|uniref:HalOD1 output domain-containing protein n=1 Tax=Haloprofundus halobius TaxID=2876194 RepID=UPI001CCAE2B3|nr:HalOD1 output domain-containing protein [Haloprofundus halobius]
MSVIQESSAKAEAVAPSQVVVERVAASEGVAQTELVPLYEAVDPEALDVLAETGRDGDSALWIEFPYHGYEVTVTSEGAVHIDKGAEFRS